jgi:hypothetical protein
LSERDRIVLFFLKTSAVEAVITTLLAGQRSRKCLSVLAVEDHLVFWSRNKVNKYYIYISLPVGVCQNFCGSCDKEILTSPRTEIYMGSDVKILDNHTLV